MPSSYLLAQLKVPISRLNTLTLKIACYDVKVKVNVKHEFKC